ncbi:MAG: glycoside hydrolase family 25 protein [Ruminococcus sp.]|nr:glycoside hydrolase family 25 protein [Ruminococcus sp.]
MARKKKNRNFKIIAIIEAVVILVLAVPLVKLTLMFSSKNGGTVPAINTEPDVRTRAVIEKEETFYQTDGEKIIMDGGSLGEIYMPALADVPKSEVDSDSVVTRNGYSFYKDKDKITSIAGIDVSEFQGYIDWKQVKDAGIEFAFIRIGCRTYSNGEIIFDERFKENLYSADRAGIKTGVYFFSQALTVDEAIEEADAVIDAIEPFNITYPVVFDWEIIYEDYARTDEITIESLADCCVAFCERIKSAGYTPMIYQNKSTLLFKVDLPRVKEYDIWLAEYNDEPTYYYDFKIWQYASDGRVPGISTDVDMNISFKDYSKQ